MLRPSKNAPTFIPLTQQPSTRVQSDPSSEQPRAVCSPPPPNSNPLPPTLHLHKSFHPSLSITWSPEYLNISSVQFSRSVVSDSLRLHGLQHARLPYQSPAPRACSNSCPLSWGCHPTISSSVIPFFSFLQSFPASRSFPMSPFFTLGGQSIGVSASVLPMNIHS